MSKRDARATAVAVVGCPCDVTALGTSSLALARTHTHSRTCAHTHTRTRTHAHAHINTHRSTYVWPSYELYTLAPLRKLQGDSGAGQGAAPGRRRGGGIGKEGKQAAEAPQVAVIETCGLTAEGVFARAQAIVWRLADSPV